MCIPSKQHRRLRNAAIARIHPTHLEATKVLVPDRDLELARVKSPWVENFAKVSLSQWYRRLWTLVEGTLAPNLHFKFSEGVFKVNESLGVSFQQENVSDELALSTRKFNDILMGMTQ
jgi:hypothetical protein